MTVATLSGHKSLKILKDRYGHYDDQTLERAMSVFDRIVGLDSAKVPQYKNNVCQNRCKGR